MQATEQRSEASIRIVQENNPSTSKQSTDEDIRHRNITLTTASAADTAPMINTESPLFKFREAQKLLQVNLVF